MVESIGSKIKSVASVMFWLNIIVSVLLGIRIIFNESGKNLWLGGILFIVSGALFSYLSSLLVYGFGKLIENTEELLAVKEILLIKRREELKKLQTEGLITKEQYYEKLSDLE